MWMPLVKLLQFMHCALLASGLATKWSSRTKEENDQLREAIDYLHAQKEEKAKEKK